ncbi:cytochrome c oxidase subunit 3 [Ramlibacter albus]|uniref:Cytochrome c oxidase subunit 3 n=1 Tax=Ramlibacter albus TaxID=2079448 RepID=A0A923S1Q9_9BURK|nr:cytochrome c oxidase subunit 3 [Ramlibacter albus]MBC5764689.1 cytochrome c oxidase subunit 3 [Ramlibacter albus]
MNSKDVRELPSYRFSHHALTWWGTMGVIAIEGTVFALAVMAYYYLRSHSNTWPMSMKPPELLWGTLNTVVLVASGVPNHLAKKAAEAHDIHGVRLWLGVSLLFGLAFIVVRCFEFAALNCRWDSNAYGSIVWVLLGLHTTHLVTDVYDSAVLYGLFFTDKLDGKRFVDVSENAVYWYFVLAAWLPIYFTIYFGARAV